MSALDWILSTALFVLYLGLLFTVCLVTFQKGHIVLGILGIFIPLLWLIGAILPAKPGSPYAISEATRMRQPLDQPMQQPMQQPRPDYQAGVESQTGQPGTATT